MEPFPILKRLKAILRDEQVFRFVFEHEGVIVISAVRQDGASPVPLGVHILRPAQYQESRLKGAALTSSTQVPYNVRICAVQQFISLLSDLVSHIAKMQGG